MQKPPELEGKMTPGAIDEQRQSCIDIVGVGMINHQHDRIEGRQLPPDGKDIVHGGKIVIALQCKIPFAGFGEKLCLAHAGKPRITAMAVHMESAECSRRVIDVAGIGLTFRQPVPIAVVTEAGLSVLDPSGVTGDRKDHHGHSAERLAAIGPPQPQPSFPLEVFLDLANQLVAGIGHGHCSRSRMGRAI